jgi:hypothetical protein
VVGNIRGASIAAESNVDYEGLLRLHIRPSLGAQFDIQSVYAQMFNCSTVGYRPEQSSTNAVIQSTFRQAVRWKMPTEDQDA